MEGEQSQRGNLYVLERLVGNIKSAEFLSSRSDLSEFYDLFAGIETGEVSTPHHSIGI